MTATTLRKEVQQYINYADERFLRMVHSLAKEYAKKDDTVVGFHVGKSVKKSQLLDDLKEAEQQIERGEYITIDKLEKESEAW
jgi:5'-3' exonuclease